MIGVELWATNAKTRSKNGAKIKEKVGNIRGAWCSGKFMELILRGHSCNMHMLSKVYFKCNTIAMNKEDINSVMVDARKWLLQDILPSPPPCP